MDALLTNIKLITNYEKVKSSYVHGCTVEQCETFDYLQVNGEGCEGFGAFYKSKLA